MNNIPEMSEEEIKDAIDNIDVEIKDILAKHHAIECFLEGIKPLTEDEDAQDEIDMAFGEFEHGLKGLIEAMKTLELAKLELWTEIDSRDEAEHQNQERHGTEQL